MKILFESVKDEMAKDTLLKTWLSLNFSILRTSLMQIVPFSLQKIQIVLFDVILGYEIF